jgi:hypothetical protein
MKKIFYSTITVLTIACNNTNKEAKQEVPVVVQTKENSKLVASWSNDKAKDSIVTFAADGKVTGATIEAKQYANWTLIGADTLVLASAATKDTFMVGKLTETDLEITKGDYVTGTTSSYKKK